MCPRAFHVAFLLTLLAGPLTAQQAPTSGDSTSLTIYDSNFSVVRTAIELGLQPGVNDVATTKVTTQLEPDSVVLTNQAGPGTFKILEQSYVSGIDTQERLKPTVKWQIESEKAQNLHAEFAYITGGLSWQAAYNAIVPDAAADVTGDQRGDILGWITISNQSGADFPAAHIKLMAGDGAKPLDQDFRIPRQIMNAGFASNTELQEMQIGQKAFDNFHFYDLNRTIHVGDGEVKQIQFLTAGGVSISRAYVYDGAATNRQPIYDGRVNDEPGYGLDAMRTKVNIAQEIRNTSANHLGIPLPSGRLRLYSRDSRGQIDFVGEDLIPHIPTGGSINIISGDVFDVKGARTQTDFHVSQNGRTLDETIQIKLTNQRPQPVVVTVVEHLYRGKNWEVTEKSADYTAVDSNTIQFPVKVPAKGESTLTYSVRYSW
ncbi:MAG: hypothetical protein WBQ95_01445 [Terracidiphilus sp.]